MKKGSHVSPEVKEKMRLSHIGKKFSLETIEKMRKKNHDRKPSPQAVEKARLANTGKKRTPENIEKIRLGAIGRKMSPEAIEKSRLGHIGLKQSPESIEKMSLAQRVAQRSKTKHGGGETPIHRRTKESIGNRLASLGYDVSLEKFITVHNTRYAIDVYAKKGDDVIVFEVGLCPTKKIIALKSRYPKVLHVPKKPKYAN